MEILKYDVNLNVKGKSFMILIFTNGLVKCGTLRREYGRIHNLAMVENKNEKKKN